MARGGQLFRRPVILVILSLTLLGTSVIGLLVARSTYPDLLECAVLLDERRSPEAGSMGSHSALLWPMSWFSGSEIIWTQFKVEKRCLECFRYDFQRHVEKPIVGLNKTFQQRPLPGGYRPYLPWPSSLSLHTLSSDANWFLAASQGSSVVECFDASGKSGGSINEHLSFGSRGLPMLFWLSDNKTCVGWEYLKKAIVRWEPLSREPPAFTPGTVPEEAIPFAADDQRLYFTANQPGNLFSGQSTDIGVLPFVSGSHYHKLFTIGQLFDHSDSIQLSPDGRWIAWMNDLESRSTPEFPVVSDLFRKFAGGGRHSVDVNWAFWIAKSDGTERRCIGVLKLEGDWQNVMAGILAFSPDNSRLAFYLRSQDRWKIYAINLDKEQ